MKKAFFIVLLFASICSAQTKIVSGVALQGANDQNLPSNPTGTSSTTGVMMGLARTITPAGSGNVDFRVIGDVANSNALGGIKIKLYYGTGTAPTNGAALTGTAITGWITLTGVVGVNDFTPFTTCGTVSSLSVGTTYWYDIAVAAITAGTASAADISTTANEQAGIQTSGLTVPNGGTGVATGTAHSIPIFEGTSAFANTGTGTTGQILTSNGSSSDPTFQSNLTPTTKSYTVTTANATNNTATDVWSFTIPANTWADGEIIQLLFLADMLNNTGSGQSCQNDIKCNGTTIISGSTFEASSATEGNAIKCLTMIRDAAYIKLFWGTFSSNTLFSNNIFTGMTFMTSGGASNDPSIDFTTNLTLKSTVTLPVTDANLFFKVSKGRATKTTLN